ncbi:MAG: polysaccharide biosynthesis tyrosine autokinase [Alphaproteobacteria bacterium]|nr:polysaccharide biosynthesis tyrosine autokinase [Alphaproteobacteria bacterium]
MSTVTQFPTQEYDPMPDAGGFMPAADSETLSLRRLLSIVKRRKYLIAGVVLILSTIAYLMIQQITPLYSASAKIVVEPNRQNVVDIDQVVSGVTPDYYTNETEAEVIRSRSLAYKAVDRLNLTQSPLFNPLLRVPEPSLTEVAVKNVKLLFLSLIGTPEDVTELQQEASADPHADSPLLQMPEAERTAYLREIAAAQYQGGLSVSPSPRSRVITISYVSTDPTFAAEAANTTANLYIEDQLESLTTATTDAGDFLQRRVNELRERVITQEREIARYRADAGIIDAGGITVYQQQLARANEELSEARIARSEAEARFNQVQELLQTGSGLETAAAVLNSDLISRLREQEAEVIRKVAEFQTQLRPGHPRLQLAENELADLRAAIEREVQKIASNLRNEVQIARVRESNIREELDRLEGTLEEQNEAQATLQSLASELSANKQLYETFLERLKETDILENTEQQADARVISRATVPGGPFRPNKQLMMIAAVVFSAFVGFALAFVAEFMDSGFRSTAQLENLSGVAALGMVPALTKGQTDGKRPHEFAVARPNSTYGEAIRSVRTGLMLSSVDRPPKTVLITSSIPGEGKTSTSLSIAMTAAKSGQRVIILDCDLRNSSLHAYMDVPNQRGLSDYLAGQAQIEDVIEIHPSSTLHYITAGSRAPNPTDMLSSHEMRDLIRQLGEMYDMVVLDTPPLMAVSDALVLMRDVDRTLFLVRWEKTRRETALAGIKQALEAGANMAGTVLTQVNVKKHASYDYGDSGYYYYGSYRKYYTD